MLRDHDRDREPISIHALREEGDMPRSHLTRDEAISIHALREEGDLLRARTRARDQLSSIHALREEGDKSTRSTFPAATNFYPRPPRGGRPNHHRGGRQHYGFLSTPSARRATAVIFNEVHQYQFLSTPSARRATGDAIDDHRAAVISIHALREEGDVHLQDECRLADHISIHALREEGDERRIILAKPSPEISIHALREEGDR